MREPKRLRLQEPDQEPKTEVKTAATKTPAARGSAGRTPVPSSWEVIGPMYRQMMKGPTWEGFAASSGEAMLDEGLLFGPLSSVDAMPKLVEVGAFMARMDHFEYVRMGLLIRHDGQLFVGPIVEHGEDGGGLDLAPAESRGQTRSNRTPGIRSGHALEDVVGDEAEGAGGETEKEKHVGDDEDNGDEEGEEAVGATVEQEQEGGTPKRSGDNMNMEEMAAEVLLHLHVSPPQCPPPSIPKDVGPMWGEKEKQDEGAGDDAEGDEDVVPPQENLPNMAEMEVPGEPLQLLEFEPSPIQPPPQCPPPSVPQAMEPPDGPALAPTTETPDPFARLWNYLCDENTAKVVDVSNPENPDTRSLEKPWLALRFDSCGKVNFKSGVMPLKFKKNNKGETAVFSLYKQPSLYMRGSKQGNGNKLFSWMSGGKEPEVQQLRMYVMKGRVVFVSEQFDPDTVDWKKTAGGYNPFDGDKEPISLPCPKHKRWPGGWDTVKKLLPEEEFARCQGLVKSRPQDSASAAERPSGALPQTRR